MGKNKGKKKWILYFLFGGFILKLFYSLFKNKDISNNFKDFFRKEKNEIKELKSGKETLKKYCSDSCSIFKQYFIPHDCNDHKPKILRAKTLTTIVVLLIILKASVTGYLFFIYPDLAKMTEKLTDDILILTNKDRASNGLSALYYSSELSKSAMAKAEDMAMKNYFAHHGPDGKKPWEWISRDDYAYIFVGENLAMNFSSANSVHRALMNSPSHKKNILNEKYKDIGLSVISGEINGKNTNILVELFAARKEPTIAIAGNIDTIEPTIESAIKSQSGETAVLGTESPEEKVEPLSPQIKKENSKVDSDNIITEPLKDESVIKEEPTTKPLIIGRTESEKIAELKKKEDRQANASPNQRLEDSPNKKIAYFSPSDDKKIGIAAKSIVISRYIYLSALALVILSLLINIFYRIKIQHKSIIVQALVVILFIVGLVSVRLHFLEDMVSRVAVL